MGQAIKMPLGPTAAARYEGVPEGAVTSCARSRVERDGLDLDHALVVAVEREASRSA